MAEHDRFIVFGAPSIGEEEIAEVTACMRSGGLGTGLRVARFEEAFAAYKQASADRVAAVNACTAARAQSVGPRASLLPAALRLVTGAVAACDEAGAADG